MVVLGIGVVFSNGGGSSVYLGCRKCYCKTLNIVSSKHPLTKLSNFPTLLLIVDK